MSPTVVQATEAYVASFVTPILPSHGYSAEHAPQCVVPRVSALGVQYPYTPSRVPAIKRQRYTTVGGKRKKVSPPPLAAVARSASSPPSSADPPSSSSPDTTPIPTEPSASASLLHLLLHRHAHLLKLSADGTHYIVDLTVLDKIKMRKRYRSLGCTLHLSKDLTSVDIVPVDTSVPPAQLSALAQVALTVFTLLLETATKLWGVLTPAFSSGVLAPYLPTNLGGTRSAAALNEPVTLSVTQKTLYPFQETIPALLDKVDGFVLAPKGLLFQLTGMDSSSLLSFIQSQMGAVAHQLPTAVLADPTLASLPLLHIGVQYYEHFVTFVEDALAKGLLVTEDLLVFLKRFHLPEDWSPVQKLAYLLWNLTFYHHLTIASVQENLTSFGSFLTLSGETLFKGLQAVIKAFKALFSFKGTSLVATSDVIDTPVLARKFISLKELIEKQPEYKEIADLVSPTKIFVSPI